MVPLAERVDIFADAIGVDEMCRDRLRRTESDVLEVVLANRRWGRRTHNISAAVNAEVKRAREMLARP
eukprot:8885378-Alexandrium_andersonii.AAC.1